MGVLITETLVDLKKRQLTRGFLVYRFGSGESPTFWEKRSAFGEWEPVKDRDVEVSLDSELDFALSKA